MGTYDQDRYRSLIARAAFDCSFYKGTIQDQSAAQRAMSFVGAPTWGRINGLPCLKQNAAAEGITSAVVPSVLDITGTVTFEALSAINTSTGFDSWLYQVSGGGFQFRTDIANSRFEVLLLTAGGATARLIYTGAILVPIRQPRHMVIVSRAGGTAGSAWMNSIPTAANLFGAGVAANPANSVILAGGAGTGTFATSLVRCWRGDLTNEDVSALYGAAKSLVGGEI